MANTVSSVDLSQENFLYQGADLLNPQVRLHGSIDDNMLDSFHEQLSAALGSEGRIVVELTTMGGGADTARRIAEQIRLCREYLERELVFVGVATVYSAGVTVMSAFPTKDRYLARDTVLLIHGRQISENETTGGPLSAALLVARSRLAELENGLALQNKGFADLIAGSDVSNEEIQRCAETNWFLNAEEALRRKLVTGLI